MIQIIELLAPAGSVCRPTTPLRRFRGVTIHDTGNTNATADAKAHADLLRGSWATRDTSWHYSVDDHSIYRSIPENEISWHAGDGASGVGNNETVSIESCVNDGNDYEKTIENMADLSADILFRHGVRIAGPALFQHFDWSGKNCPARIRAEKRWDGFKASVQSRLSALWEPASRVISIAPTAYTVTDPEGVYIKAGPDIGTSPVVGFIKTGETVVADKITEIDGYVWIHIDAGWAALGEDNGGPFYMASGSANDSATIAKLKAEVASLSDARDRAILDLKAKNEVIRVVQLAVKNISI